MDTEYIKEEEIVENYCLTGVYEEVRKFTELTQILDEKIHKQPFHDRVRKYFHSK